MLLVKSNIFGTISNTQKKHETTLYLNKFRYKFLFFFFIIIEFSIKPSRDLVRPAATVMWVATWGWEPQVYSEYRGPTSPANDTLCLVKKTPKHTNSRTHCSTSAYQIRVWHSARDIMYCRYGNARQPASCASRRLSTLQCHVGTKERSAQH